MVYIPHFPLRQEWVAYLLVAVGKWSGHLGSWFQTWCLYRKKGLYHHKIVTNGRNCVRSSYLILPPQPKVRVGVMIPLLSCYLPKYQCDEVITRLITLDLVVRQQEINSPTRNIPRKNPGLRRLESGSSVPNKAHFKLRTTHGRDGSKRLRCFQRSWSIPG